MTTLYLVRHGETVDNARQIMQGQTQGELNATGISQAEALRDKLSDIHIDAFVSSDLYRSIQTCRILAQGRQVPMVETPLLRERDWGDFTGEYIPSPTASGPPMSSRLSGCSPVPATSSPGCGSLIPTRWWWLWATVSSTRPYRACIISAP